VQSSYHLNLYDYFWGNEIYLPSQATIANPMALVKRYIWLRYQAAISFFDHMH